MKPKVRVCRVADSNALCIEVRPGGAKLWRCRYRYNGRATMTPVSEYPAVSLAERRKMMQVWADYLDELRAEPVSRL